MRAIDGLGLDGWVPPRIVQDDVTGGSQVQPGARGAEAEEKHRSVRVVLEAIDDLLPVFRLARKDMRWDLPLLAFLLQQLQHLHELAEQQDLLPFSYQRIEQLKQSLGLAGNRIAPHEFRVAANLAQPRQRSQHMDLALIKTFFSHRFHYFLASASHFSQIKLALFLAQIASASLLYALRQVPGDKLFEAS